MIWMLLFVLASVCIQCAPIVMRCSLIGFQVMSLIGNFSNDFPQYNSANPEMVSGLRSPPDYSKLYLYLASMLDETLTMPELSPLGEWFCNFHCLVPINVLCSGVACGV